MGVQTAVRKEGSCSHDDNMNPSLDAIVCSPPNHHTDDIDEHVILRRRAFHVYLANILLSGSRAMSVSITPIGRGVCSLDWRSAALHASLLALVQHIPINLYGHETPFSRSSIYR
jgi:hypothetical protein